jgi:hypothetical protein
MLLYGIIVTLMVLYPAFMEIRDDDCSLGDKVFVSVWTAVIAGYTVSTMFLLHK